MDEMHTPGPWEIVGATHVWSPSGHANVASCSAPRTIDHVGYAPPDIRNLAETAANARLIAAAPELLEALEELLSVEADEERLLEVRAKARAAIKKATD